MENNTDRRSFLLKNVALAGALVGIRSHDETSVGVNALEEPKSVPIRHVPRSYKEFTALNDQKHDVEQVMMAAAAAAGCDGAAFYVAEKGGKFSLQKHIDIYPNRSTEEQFAKTLDKFDPDTFKDEAAARDNATYQIPVHATDVNGKPTKAIRGVIVVHAPQKFADVAKENYSRIQTEEEARDKNDAHETARVRMGRIIMAQHIVAAHEDLLGIDGANEQQRKVILAREHGHRKIDTQIAYFTQLVNDLFATFTTPSGKEVRPDESSVPVKLAKNATELKTALRQLVGTKNKSPYSSDQPSHLLGVTDLLKLSADAVNKGQEKPVLTEKQLYLMELKTIFHDVGKAQNSGKFHEEWKSKDAAEQKRRDEYFMAANQNHPYLTDVIEMPMYGLGSGGHHHGDLRYSKKEYEAKMGKGSYERDTILLEDQNPEHLSALLLMMRVCDVTEAITGGVDLPLHACVKQLGGYWNDTNPNIGKVQMKEGKPQINCDSMHPEYVCFMIANNVFHDYGKQRHAEELAAGNEKGWWSNRPGVGAKYDEAKVTAEENAILERFGWAKIVGGKREWTPKRDEMEKDIRNKMRNDPLVYDASLDMAGKRAMGGGF